MFLKLSSEYSSFKNSDCDVDIPEKIGIYYFLIDENDQIAIKCEQIKIEYSTFPFVNNNEKKKKTELHKKVITLSFVVNIKKLKITVKIFNFAMVNYNICLFVIVHDFLNLHLGENTLLLFVIMY